MRHSGSGPEQVPTLRLRDGETAVVGYGSLLSPESVARTLGREPPATLVQCRIEGWRRSWDVAMPNGAFYYESGEGRVYPERILYLNVRPAPGAVMNCVVFVAGAEELGMMHDREWIYQHAPVTGSLRGVRILGGDAIMYVGLKDHLIRNVTDPRVAAVRRSYLRMLDRALAAVDPAFRAEYEATTDPVPEHLVVDDRLDPGRPSPWEGRGYRP